MYFVISASELISGGDVGICTMQPLIFVEDDIRAYDYLSMILIELSFFSNVFFLDRTMKPLHFPVTLRIVRRSSHMSQSV